MRLLHVADLHLGQVYGSFRRAWEHEVVLGHLLDILEKRAVDALLVAGDVFHRLNPPAEALRLWYRFLSEAQRRRPGLEIVAVAGNHDSVARFEVVQPFATPLRIALIGRLPRKEDGALDPERLLVPLHDADGRQRVLCVAVPYLRPSDLRCDASQPGWQRTGVEAVYAEAFELARERCGDGVGMIATGHLEMAGATITPGGVPGEAVEMRTPFEGAHAPGSELFPRDLAYTALGHVHLAQAVAGRENVRYAGSPLPLSMSEVGYEHQAVLVELDTAGSFAGYEICPLEPPVRMIRVPRSQPGAASAAPLEEVLAELERLPADTEATAERTWPYLAVHVCDEAGEGSERVRERVHAVLRGKAVRLVALRLKRPELPETAAASGTASEGYALEPGTLAELDPEMLFALRYAQEQLPDQAAVPPSTAHELTTAVPAQMRCYVRELITEAHARLAADEAEDQVERSPATTAQEA